MVRHFIKPGITGLAQTNGYRGEVESEKDIVNRVKYDIFYLENWSLLLDIKIVFLTVASLNKGNEFIKKWLKSSERKPSRREKFFLLRRIVLMAQSKRISFFADGVGVIKKKG